MIACRSTSCTPRPLHICRHQIRHPILTTEDLQSPSMYCRLLSRSGPTSSSSRCSRRHELLRRRRPSTHDLLRRRSLSTHIRLRGRRLSTSSHQLILSLALTPPLGYRPAIRSSASSSSTISVNKKIRSLLHRRIQCVYRARSIRIVYLRTAHLLCRCRWFRQSCS
jgi:hypothetical protein